MKPSLVISLVGLLMAALIFGLLQLAPPKGTVAATAGGPSAPRGSGEIIARVNGEPIWESDIEAAAAILPPEYANYPADVMRPALISQLIDRKLLADAAKRTGVDRDADIMAQAHQAYAQVIGAAFMERALDEEVTDDKVRARYDEFTAGFTPEDEVNARHILLETEGDAKAVLKDLKNGADFGELAQEKSTGPSGANGGALGWFVKGDMVAPFAEAAFAMQPGDLSDPVETQFGWHVILVEDRRKSEAPSFEEVEEQLLQAMQQQAIGEIFRKLRQQAKIERYDLPEADPHAAMMDQAEEPAEEIAN